MPSRRESRSRSEGFKQKEREENKLRKKQKEKPAKHRGMIRLLVRPTAKEPENAQKLSTIKRCTGILAACLQGAKTPPTPFPIDKSLPQNRRNKVRSGLKSAEHGDTSNLYKGRLGPTRLTKPERGAREQKKELKAAFKSFYLETCNHGQDPPKRHKAKAHRLPCDIPLKAATLNIRGLNGPNGITKRQLIGDVMRKDCLDILLLTETQVNTSNVGTHGNFIVFFSSDIQPYPTKEIS